MGRITPSNRTEEAEAYGLALVGALFAGAELSRDFGREALSWIAERARNYSSERNIGAAAIAGVEHAEQLAPVIQLFPNRDISIHNNSPLAA